MVNANGSGRRFPRRWRLAGGAAVLSALLAVAAVLAVGSAYGQSPSGNDLSRCPRVTYAFHPNRSDRDATLVPVGAIRIVLCRYGLSTAENRAVEAKPTLIDEMTRQLNALKALPHRKFWRCPESDGTLVGMVFHYRHRASREALIQTNGCQWVKAGNQRRWAFFQPGSRLIERLLALTDCRPHNHVPYGCRI